MSVSVPTLDRIRNLEQLYRSGYRSATVDATIDKLLSVEVAKARQEADSLRSRLAEMETEYGGMSSADFLRRFQAGELDDSADMFEWSAYYQMWLSAEKRVSLLDLQVAR